MATDDRVLMKKDLLQIASKIEPGLYIQLINTFLIPDNVVKEFETAELYFVEQYLNDDLKPWNIANALKTLNYNALAEEFEEFAKKYNFIKTEPIQSKNKRDHEIMIMELLKVLKSELSQNELLRLRVSKCKTFESIFTDLLNLNLWTPSLEELRQKLQDENREDLALSVAIASQTLSQLDPVAFERVVTLCLDTLDVDMFSLLSDLREAFSKEFSYFRTLTVETKLFSYSKDFIPLTFTAEVDAKTLPLTGGSDSELMTQMENANKQEKKETRYIDAHSEIYSPALNGKLISLIGYPGTGKSFYCNKLVNEFINQDNVSYRFVLVIACRNIKWHVLEEQCLASPGKKSEMLELFLRMIVPSFANSKEIVRIILSTEGNGLLLVIDSFDEFPQRFNFPATLLYRILKRQVLTRSTILITSRPGAWNQLLTGYGSEFSFHQSWQLLGFSPEQRDQFITAMLANEKAVRCKTFLVTKPELNILSLIPMNISLIAALVDNTTSLSNINTLTDMYTSLVVYTLNKELRRIDPSTPCMASLNEMPADMLCVFTKLAELSYHALLAKQITFSSTKFSEIITKYKNGLGLFHIIKVVTQHKTTIDYLSCPHLTLQEFLSAWHLAQKSLTDIESIVQQTFSDSTWPAMKVCVRFLCGILTQGHNTIINIITDNLHRTSAPLLNCKYGLFQLYINNSYYADLHFKNTDTHLSVLPYVLETNQPSIISSYYKLLCPANITIPHFYLRYNITPVDTNSLTQYLSLLPPNSTISVLSINLSLLNNIQVDMLANCINITSIDTLIVPFSIIYSETLSSYYIENIIYEIQQLHVNADSYMLILQAKFIDIITSNTYIDDIYKLQYALSSLKLPITASDSTTQTDNIHIQILLSFVRNITNASCLHTPKHIYYQFTQVSFVDDTIINALIDTISSHATYVIVDHCYFSPQFITTLVTSLSKLEYLNINDESLIYLRSKLNHTTIDAISFQKLKERRMKGLYLVNVALQDSILYEYLKSQTNLQEIQLYDTTDSTPATLHAIQHLTSLHYFYIQANDNALKEKHINSEESMSTYHTILYTNRHTLSYADFSHYNYFITERYTALMLSLSQCNLQCIDLTSCFLTHSEHGCFLSPYHMLHMQALATTINQLHTLLCIDMGDITAEGLITLNDTLATHNTLKWINLYNCDLSSAPVIISLINKFPCLQMIVLHDDDDASENELKIFTQQKNIHLLI